MELARHHDADLTFGRDAHTRHEDLSKVVDRLADLWVFPPLRIGCLRGTTRDHPEPSGVQSRTVPSTNPSSYTSRFYHKGAQPMAGLEHGDRITGHSRLFACRRRPVLQTGDEEASRRLAGSDPRGPRSDPRGTARGPGSPSS